MTVDPADGACRACGGVLEIIDADDATMIVRCLDCAEEYPVETDAFGDGAMHYQLEFLMRRKGGQP